jgi:hypothetical protein
MNGLEHAFLIIDVSLGFIILCLAFINYSEPGNNLRKIIGIIGLSIVAICTLINFVYLNYCGDIFNIEPIRNIPILYSNKESWKSKRQRYLGKRQYNYDSNIYKALRDSKSEFNLCRANRIYNSRLNYQGIKVCEYIYSKFCN